MLQGRFAARVGQGLLPMKRHFAARFVASTIAAILAAVGAWSADACTSLKFTAEDGTQIYARTMEWGGSGTKELTSFRSWSPCCQSRRAALKACRLSQTCPGPS